MNVYLGLLPSYGKQPSLLPPILLPLWSSGLLSEELTPTKGIPVCFWQYSRNWDLPVSLLFDPDRKLGSLSAQGLPAPGTLLLPFEIFRLVHTCLQESIPAQQLQTWAFPPHSAQCSQPRRWYYYLLSDLFFNYELKHGLLPPSSRANCLGADYPNAQWLSACRVSQRGLLSTGDAPITVPFHTPYADPPGGS